MTTQAQHENLKAARDEGWRNCLEVFDALGFAPVNAGGMTRSKVQVAFRWIEDAGEKIVRVIPDGESDIPLARRAGCYNLDAVVETKNAYYAAIAANEAEAWAEAERRLEEFEAAKAARLAEADAAIAERRAEIAAQQAANAVALFQRQHKELVTLGVPPHQILEFLGDPPEGVVIPTPVVVTTRNRAETIGLAAKTYTGPMTKRGYPRLAPFRVHANLLDITRKERTTAWKALT